jgi:hypothetical protein
MQVGLLTWAPVVGVEDDLVLRSHGCFRLSWRWLLLGIFSHLAGVLGAGSGADLGRFIYRSRLHC